MAKTASEVVHVAGRDVTITSPTKLYFPDAGYTKLDLVRYYIAVAEGALAGTFGRPMALKRYVRGIREPFFFQKRAPVTRPEWIEVVELAYPSGRTAEEVVLRDAAQLAWIINLGCVDLNPHPVRADDLEHPDELRIDLDPGPGIGWEQIREVAMVTRGALADVGLTGWPKTSGSRGIHIYVRLERKWSFDQVRTAALAIARDVEKRAPTLATSKWWKEERHGVFLDYNQNAKDRTVASAYSVRPLEDARVSTPVTWDELATCDPADFNIVTVQKRFAKIGDPARGMDAQPESLERLLQLHEQQGQGDAPWPPHYEKKAGEPPRVQPSKRRAPSARTADPKQPGGSKRKSKMPLIEISKAALKPDVLAGLERWKSRHPDTAKLLAEDDVLVDQMRGSSSVWWRVRVNLRHVPEESRPAQEALDPDYDPWTRHKAE